MKGQKGFTLIELMIVVAVIGVLSAIAIPQYQKYVAKAEVASALATMTGVKTNIEASTVENGLFPKAGTESALGIPQSMDLGSITLEPKADSSGNIIFTFNSSTDKSVSSLVSKTKFYLHRDNNGIWSCKNSSVTPVPEEVLPKNCKTKASAS
ncbi:pilin [Photobacterium damselae]